MHGERFLTSNTDCVCGRRLFHLFSPNVFQPSLYFLFLAAFPEHGGANFPPVKTTSPAAGARCSPPAPTVIAVQHWSALRPPADLDSNPAHGGKQPSAICGTGTAGQTEGRRMISLVLFSKEENSMEKCSDSPTSTHCEIIACGT